MQIENCIFLHFGGKMCKVEFEKIAKEVFEKDI